MKKLMFSLIAIGTFALSSASTGEIEKKSTEIKQPEKKDATQTVKENDVRSVVCEASVGGIVYYNVYSCFFCWGGAENGCKAELLDKIVELNN